MIEFEAELVRLPGKIAWTVFYIPASFSETVGTRGRVSVRLVVDGAEFAGTLLPSSNGHYQVYNQAIREHCRKKLGDTVHVALETDQQPRELEIPQDIAAMLAADEAVLTRFSSLPYYIRREEINKIGAAKTAPTREKRIQALLEKLAKD